MPEKDYQLENEKPEDYLISFDKYKELNAAGALARNHTLAKFLAWYNELILLFLPSLFFI